MTTEISNTDDVIDSRDIIKRIEDLQSELDSLEGEDRAEFLESEDYEELQALKSLADEAEGYPDWAYGATLIRESYWETYVQELVEELGYISKDFPWWIHIDWEATARDVAMDYTTVSFGDVDYYIRMS